MVGSKEEQVTRITKLLIAVVLACAGGGAVDKYVEEAGRFAKSNEPAKAVEVMERAAKERPRSAKAHAYLGLYLGMSAGRTSDFSEAGKLVQAAFAQLDQAAAIDSLDIDARYFRGLLSVQVPDFFGRLDPGVRDLEFVLARPEKTRKPLDHERLVSVWSLLGTGYQKQQKMGEAAQAWQKVAELATDTTVVAKAKARLAAIGAPDSGAAPAEPIDLPDNPAALWELGRHRLDSGDSAAAVEPLRKAAGLDSTNLEGLKLLAHALQRVLRSGYDERIALNADLRTRLAFEYYRVLDRVVGLAPEDMELRLWRGAAGAYSPFFVGKLDEAIKDLEAVAAADGDDETKAEALYLLGLAYRHKGTSYWTKVATKFAKTEAAKQVLAAMRPPLAEFDPAKVDKPAVAVSFVLAFQDELAPQTAVWVEDDKGGYVRTLYVSGFSGHARETQVDLPFWARSSEFRGCDAVTGASIDLGQHVYTWDLKDLDGRPVRPGTYVFKVESAWWPSMKAEVASVRLAVGNRETRARADPKGLIPSLEAHFLPRNPD
jgi:tetratricopeptide (TPR) repeat protein